MAKEPSINMLRALYLRATYDVQQQDIAALLSVNQGMVAKWLIRGVKEGWTQEQRRYTFREARLTSERLEEVRQVDSWALRLARLREVPTKTGVTLRAIRVFRSTKRRTSSMEVRLKLFSRHAAGVLYHTIHRATTCAVASGRTISDFVDALADGYGGRAVDEDPRPQTKVRFVPVWPEDVNNPRPEVSSSALADRLHDVFNSRWTPADGEIPPRPPSLNGVPPFRPHYFGAEEFRRYLEEDFPSFRTLFGTRRGP